MQSFYGKLRAMGRQAIGSLKNIQKISSLESRLVRNQYSAFNADHSGFSTSLFLHQNVGTGTIPTTFSRRFILTSALPSRGLSSNLSQLPARNVSTESTSESVSASPEVPQRIKFKRLDKTARHIMQIIDKESVEEVKTSREIPEIKPGYIVQLKVEVPENKRRVAIIKGIVIARRNAGLNSTFRIRRLVAGVGIENLFHLYSPNIKEIQVLDKKKVRRAKLYYLRDKMNALKKQ